ncbi:MAG: hypothetical protein OJF51_002102 [Nitrospira sp.]|nr:MAG: hypothetical protein OJF51_002102 [Nitrospira sp.]
MLVRRFRRQVKPAQASSRSHKSHRLFKKAVQQGRSKRRGEAYASVR